MYKIVIKSRFRFFRFLEKITIFDFEYGNRLSLQQCGSQDSAKRYVFKWRLKADVVEESVTKDGNAFQTRVPATGKERSPIVVLRVGGTTSAGEDVDRSRRNVSTCRRFAHMNKFGNTICCV